MDFTLEYSFRVLKRFFRILKSFAASLYLNFPAKELKLIGITGTSGKSTTAALTYQILKKNNFKVGLISTLGAIVDTKNIETGLHVTTPGPIQLQKILKIMRDKSIEYVVVEASSHALEQGRFGFLRFIFAVFINIKRDHLDYHKSWKGYADDKARLIKRLEKDGRVFLNQDDVESYTYLKENKIKDETTINYSVQEEISKIKQTMRELSFEYRGVKFNIPIIGEYNLNNIIAAIKVSSELGISLKDISESLKDFEGIAGRMEIIQSEPFSVIVNFAHNTDSLEKALISLRKLVSKENKIITIFGSAGLRDIEKRSTMGEVSAKFGDISIITAEDPRTESLFKINSVIINAAIESGSKLIKRFKNHSEYLQFLKEKSLEIISKRIIYSFDEEKVDSRFDAIDLGIKLSKPGDIVICEGKGHEQSLCFGKIEYPFSDHDAIKKALNNL